MKRTLSFFIACALMAGNLALVSAAPAAQSSVSSISQAPDSPRLIHDPEVENLFSWDYLKFVLDDTGYILSSPARWNERDWLSAGIAVSAVAVTGLVADKSLQRELQKHRGGSNDDFAKAVEPFGAEYSFAVLGAFELGGYAFNDNTAKAVAHDGLASSAIAAGIITPSLKYVIGRARPSKNQGTHHFRPFSGDESFPSGHATQAFAVASVVADHYDSYLIKAASYGVASMVGYARMERNAHFISDVLAGAIIGTAVGRAIVKYNRGKRYEISVIADGDKVGAQVTRTF